MPLVLSEENSNRTIFDYIECRKKEFESTFERVKSIVELLKKEAKDVVDLQVETLGRLNSDLDMMKSYSEKVIRGKELVVPRKASGGRMRLDRLAYETFTKFIEYKFRIVESGYKIRAYDLLVEEECDEEKTSCLVSDGALSDILNIDDETNDAFEELREVRYENLKRKLDDLHSKGENEKKTSNLFQSKSSSTPTSRCQSPDVILLAGSRSAAGISSSSFKKPVIQANKSKENLDADEIFKEYVYKVQNSSSESSSMSNESKKSKQLPESAVKLMKAWYEANSANPYPTEDDRKQMAKDGSITENQVKAWFANKRNRSNNTRPKNQTKICQLTGSLNQSAVFDFWAKAKQLSENDFKMEHSGSSPDDSNNFNGGERYNDLYGNTPPPSVTAATKLAPNYFPIYTQTPITADLYSPFKVYASKQQPIQFPPLQAAQQPLHHLHALYAQHLAAATAPLIENYHQHGFNFTPATLDLNLLNHLYPASMFDFAAKAAAVNNLQQSSPHVIRPTPRAAFTPQGKTPTVKHRLQPTPITQTTATLNKTAGGVAVSKNNDQHLSMIYPNAMKALQASKAPESS